MSIPITAHFSLSEFDCHDQERTPYPVDNKEDDGRTWFQSRLVPLCNMLEVIRAVCGGHSVTITSGYRTEDHNEKLRSSDGSGTGVAKNSQHVQGRAADFSIAGLAPVDVHAVVMHLYKTGELPQLGGIGLYKGWVHVDVRPRGADNHLAQWTDPAATRAV